MTQAVVDGANLKEGLDIRNEVVASTMLIPLRKSGFLAIYNTRFHKDIDI